MPARLTAGPFRYKVYADRYLDVAKRYAHMSLKQAATSPPSLSLMYPGEDIRVTRARSSSMIYFESTKWKFVSALRRARTRSKLILRKGDGG